ncbi:SDR family NAD(P)-dependent oxidoreductase [Streptomyces klenkii]|uniref:SDR family NAD(P)-dependent oxidoreductase n=1 Tax=Streptomyces klenkii TaxID=1420899 RepID=UPI0033B5C24F
MNMTQKHAAVMMNGTGVPARDGQDIAQHIGQNLAQDTVQDTLQDIAVVGLSLRLPGSRTPEEFWDHLSRGRSLISGAPERRWRDEDHPGHPRHEFDRAGSVWGGFVDDADCFDADFFRISPHEARSMDPQQRMALELSWHALEDAGYRADRMAGSRTGVFMGVCHWDYAELIECEAEPIGARYPAGTARSLVADRVSRHFGFRGPSVVDDTACTSSLVAVEQAVRALRRGDCDHALAGGINLAWSPRHLIAFAKAGMVSPGGRYKAFDANANGYVRGEGGGVLLLKRAADARRDGDAVHALIKGIGSSDGSRAGSVTVTGPAAQAELIAWVHRRAGIAPETVTYVETHGPGTPVGDPIEIRGLQQAFADLYENRPEAGAAEGPRTGADRPGSRGGNGRPGNGKGLAETGRSPAGTGKARGGTGKGRAETSKVLPEAVRAHRCGVGSVKTGIGHLEGAAGIAGMLKVILAMRHRKLPATVGFEKLNPLIKLDGSPLYIVDRLTDWTPGRPGAAADAPAPLRAGVSSFGFGGTDAHVLLESPAPAPAPASAATGGEQWLPVSAKDEDRLRETCAGLARWARTRIERDDAPALADVARTLRDGRVPMTERVVFRASGLAEWAAQLEAVAAGEEPPAGCPHGRAATDTPDGLDADDPDEAAAFAAHVLEQGRLEQGRSDEFAAAWAQGLPVDWAQWPEPEHGRRVHLPGYAFARTPHRFTPTAGPERTGCRDGDGDDGGHESGPRRPPSHVAPSVLNAPEAHATTSAMWAWLRSADRAGGEGTVAAPGAPDSPAHAPLAALLNTAHEEDPSFTGKLVLLDDYTPRNRTEESNGEESNGEEGDGDKGDVRGGAVEGSAHDRGGCRLRRTTVELPPEATGESLLRDGGIYWITGGADGLALLLAERLCERHRATVVVGGRSAHSPEVDALQVRLPHGEVTYRCTDVTDEDAVRAAVSDIRMQYGRLDGVFHAAGVLDDCSLADKPLAGAAAVLAPTVDGAAHVDAATRGLGLDFLLLFGSVADAPGNDAPGDAARTDRATGHATVNAFPDAYAARRRRASAA